MLSEEPKYYSHRQICSNCSTENCLEIPKGIRIQEYLQRVMCSNCECSLAGPSPNKVADNCQIYYET